jgi:hypothetical protein
MYLENDDDAIELAAALEWSWEDPSNGVEEGKLAFLTTIAGALTKIAEWNGTDLDLTSSLAQALYKRGGSGSLSVGVEHSARLSFLVNAAIEWYIQTTGTLFGQGNKISDVGAPADEDDVVTSRAAPSILGFWAARFTAGDQSANRWLWPFMSADPSSTEIKMTAPCAGRVRRMDVYVNGTVTDDDIVFTLRKDGGDETDIQATLSSGGTTASDTGSVDFAAGQEIGIKAVAGGAITVGADILVTLHFSGPSV